MFNKKAWDKGNIMVSDFSVKLHRLGLTWEDVRQIMQEEVNYIQANRLKKDW